MRVIYTGIYYLAIPFIFLRLLWRSRHTKAYRKRWSERIGLIPPVTTGKQSIWIHAVSVGETIAAIPLIEAMIKQYPTYTILVTSTTPTGSALVEKRLGKSVHHCYAPFDTPTSVHRFLQRANAALCIIMETELWPNLFHGCKKHQIPIILANGRLSERSANRYKKIPKVTKSMLQSCHRLIAQGSKDGERYVSLGLDPKKLVISGNIKFDMVISESVIAQGKALRQQLGENRLALIAASTHEGEEKIILTAFNTIRETIPNLLLILVPRHQDRFDKVHDLCTTQHYAIARRSLKDKLTEQTDILLVDTIGELRMIFAAGDIAFVGGSFAPIGGHNFIEPAALGLPLLSGPHLHNFTEISQLLIGAGALQIVKTATALAKATIDLCESETLRKKIGDQAKATIEANKGALNTHLLCIKESLIESNPI